MTDITTGASATLLDKEEVKALFESVGAPAEQVQSFVEIFESAVAAQVSAQVETIVEGRVAELEAKSEEHINALNEKAEEFKLILKEEQEAKLDSYIKHFAEEFVADNKPVVESNVKAAMFTSLMGDLIKVFEAHNITLSDEKKDVLEEAESKLATTETALAESQAQVIELTRQINEGKKAEIIEAAVEGLTESQAEKVRGLVSDIVYSDLFESKVQRVVEAIASKAPAAKVETTEVVTEVTDKDALNTPEAKQVSPLMEQYLSAAKRQATKLR
jgi:hypothetical protein